MPAVGVTGLATTSAPMSSLAVKTLPLRVFGAASSPMALVSFCACGTESMMWMPSVVLAVPPGLVTDTAMLSIVSLTPGWLTGPLSV